MQAPSICRLNVFRINSNVNYLSLENMQDEKKGFLGIERKYTETHLSTSVFFCMLVINDSWFSSKNEAVSHKGMFFMYFLNTCFWWRADCRRSSQINHACGELELLWGNNLTSQHTKRTQNCWQCLIFAINKQWV